MKDSKQQGKLAILVGGGPAPGINSVIASATIEAINCGLRVIGLRDGFRWLVEGDTRHTVELRIKDVSRIHFTGGSILLTSRTNPARDEQSPEQCRSSADASSTSLPALYRRRRHDFRRGQDRRGAAGDVSAWRPCPRRSITTCRCPTTRRPSASKPPARGYRDHRVPDGGRAHDRPVVRRDLDGPQIGRTGAGDVQVGGRHAGGDPGGVSRSLPST